MLASLFRKNFLLFSHFPLAKPPRIVYNTIVAQLTAHADVAQQVERILGKDEVTGSNPVISSKDQSEMTGLSFSATHSQFLSSTLPNKQQGIIIIPLEIIVNV